MFVFWYCHKRGKQVRLEREGAAAGASGDATAEEDDEDLEVTDSDEGEEGAAEAVAEKIASDVKEETGAAEAGDGKAKDDLLNQAEPSQVPLPDVEKGEKGEKGAKLEETKSVGV